MQIFAPDRHAQLLQRRHKVGKWAPLCRNGAFIWSHLGPYSDGGTGKLSPLHKVGKFLKEGAHSCLNRALNLKLVPLVVPHYREKNIYIKNDAP